MSSKTMTAPVKKNDSTVANGAAEQAPSAEQLIAMAKERQAAIEAKREKEIELEVASATNALAGFIGTLESVRSLALEAIAERVGKTVNKQGRPDLEAWLLFVSACAFRKVSHTQFDLLCRIAVKAVKAPVAVKWTDEELTKAKSAFVKQSAKGSLGKSSASLRMNTPAAWNIDLG
jgi:hypothetical protein